MTKLSAIDRGVTSYLDQTPALQVNIIPAQVNTGEVSLTGVMISVRNTLLSGEHALIGVSVVG